MAPRPERVVVEATKKPRRRSTTKRKPKVAALPAPKPRGSVPKVPLKTE